MRRSDLDLLARTRTSPAVSVLLRLQEHRPGNAEDPLRLRALVDVATERLRAEPAGARVVEHLAEARARIDFDHPGAGLALFATPEGAHALMLPFPVPDRVVVDDRFAFRDLLVGLQRAPVYRVLTLSRHRNRLLEGVGPELRELPGFPVEVEAPVEADTPQRDLPIHEREREEAYRFVFRAVDRALGAEPDADTTPLVVAGVERDLAHFAEVTRHGRAVVGTLHGNHDRTAPAELARLAIPVVQADLARRRADAVARLIEAQGAKRAALGVDEVYRSARAGRGHLLVVEDDPRRADLPADELDRITEAVLAADGEVVVVEPGTVPGGIGLVLRY